jgi:hypothetical protein
MARARYLEMTVRYHDGKANARTVGLNDAKGREYADKVALEFLADPKVRSVEVTPTNHSYQTTRSYR